MAEPTLKEHVEALVGTFGVSDGQLGQWYSAAANDVVNRVRIIAPNYLSRFAKLEEGVGDSWSNISKQQVLNAYRTNAGTEATYREIPSSMKHRAAGTGQWAGSIHKATTSDPVYYRENGTINFLPTGGDNDISVVYVNTANLELPHTQKFSDVSYFPDEMKKLLPYYVGMEVLQYLMQAKQMPLDAEIDLSGIKIPVMPIMFTATNNVNTWDGSAQSRVIVDETTLSAAPTYTNPVFEARVKFSDYVSGMTEEDPGAFSISSTAPVAPVVDLPTIDSSSWVQPEFIAPIFEDVDWSNTEKWIETEEDPEMLAARVQEISAKAGEFTSKLSESQMRFNKELEIYNSQIQKSIQNANLESTKEGQDIQKYTTELQQYSAEVNTEVATYTAKMNRWTLAIQTKSQAWAQEENEKLQIYQTDISNNLNTFNKENAEYQAKLQIALENARLSSAGDGILMQRYANEIQAYQAEVNSKVQEYTSKFQARGVEYKWLQEEYLILKSKYESGFVPFQQPKQEQD